MVLKEDTKAACHEFHRQQNLVTLSDKQRFGTTSGALPDYLKQ